MQLKTGVLIGFIAVAASLVAASDFECSGAGSYSWPQSDNCWKYYNCVNGSTTASSGWCLPLLRRFSRDTLKCEWAWHVNCSEEVHKQPPSIVNTTTEQPSDDKNVTATQPADDKTVSVTEPAVNVTATPFTPTPSTQIANQTEAPVVNQTQSAINITAKPTEQPLASTTETGIIKKLWDDIFGNKK